MFSWFEKHILKSRKYYKILLKTRSIQLRKFSRPFHKKVYLNLRKWSQNKNNFLETRNIFLLRKVFLILRKLVLFWDIILFQVKFSCRRDKKLFSVSLFFLFWAKHSDIFLIWEHISQIKKIFLNKFWGICSADIGDTWLHVPSTSVAEQLCGCRVASTSRKSQVQPRLNW